MVRLRVASGFLYCSCYLLIEIGVEGEISMVMIGAEVKSRLPMISLKLGAAGRAMWLRAGVNM